MNIPRVFSQFIEQLVSIPMNTRYVYAAKINFVRPKVRTIYGIHTFKFTSSKIWESINTDIKHLSSIVFNHFPPRGSPLMSKFVWR